MSELNKALVSRWFEEVWNQRRAETIVELMSAECLTKVEGLDVPLTRDAFLEYHRAFLSAVPDIVAEVTLLVADGDSVIAGWRGRGTHLGPGLGIPPSSRRVDFAGLSAFEIREGRIVSGNDTWNRGEMIASLMQVRMDELCERAGLTRREAQVALMMAERYSHAQIAEQLRIQPNTARRHCERVLSKLGVHRKQDIAEAIGKIPGSVLDRHGTDVASASSAR